MAERESIRVGGHATMKMHTGGQRSSYALLLAGWLSIACFFGCANTNITPASKLLSGKLTLSWNEVPGAASYNVYFARSPGVTKLNGFKIRDAASPMTIVDLEPGRTYYFVVTVVDAQGESDESKEKAYLAAESVGALHFDDLFAQKPAPLAQATGAPGAEGQMTISWDDVPGADSYNIYWRTSAGVSKFNGKKIEKVSNPYTIQGLERGKKYYLVVTAVSGSIESKESEEVSFEAK
jgi:fibronectin type 3 domain-containing protein